MVVARLRLEEAPQVAPRLVEAWRVEAQVE